MWFIKEICDPHLFIIHGVFESCDNVGYLSDEYEDQSKASKKVEAEIAWRWGHGLVFESWSLTENWAEPSVTRAFPPVDGAGERHRAIYPLADLLQIGYIPTRLVTRQARTFDLTFLKEPAMPALCLQARFGPTVNDASVLSWISASDTPGA